MLAGILPRLSLQLPLTKRTLVSLTRPPLIAPTAKPMFAFIKKYFIPTSAVLLEESEKKILANVKTPYETRLVAIGNGDYINTLIIGDPANPPLVLAHGFGTGVGLWYPILDDLAVRFRVYAFDWVGYGRSSRPPFQATTSDEAESFFLDSFDKWRTVLGLDHFILAGHSLGGYLSACYALKKPQHVQRLILVSPVGIPAPPENFDERRRNMPMLWKVFMQLWDWNYTPQGLIRGFGPGGPGLVQRYVDARFGHMMDESDRQILINYLYHTGAQDASGEFALNTILMPGAFARNPLCHRLHSITMPTTFMYGDHDWMDKNAGQALSDSLAVETKVYIVENAGHHLYLDNPPAFMEAFVRAAGIV